MSRANSRNKRDRQVSDKETVFAIVKNNQVIGYHFKHISRTKEFYEGSYIIEMDKEEADRKFERFFFKENQ